jgi:hypothetical protein
MAGAGGTESALVSAARVRFGAAPAASRRKDVPRHAGGNRRASVRESGDQRRPADTAGLRKPVVTGNEFFDFAPATVIGPPGSSAAGDEGKGMPR